MILTYSLPLGAADWPRYLGLEGKAETTDPIAPKWDESVPELVWSAEVGKGCAGFAVADGIAITLGNIADVDTIRAFDAKSGKLIWSDHYEEPLHPKYYTGGPGASPTIHGDFVFILSKTGRLAKYQLKDGKPLWVKNLQKDFGGEAPDWGYSAAPVVHNGSILVAVNADKGAFMALNLENGELEWRSDDTQKPGYSTPVIVDHKGRKTALVFFGRALVAYDLEKQGEVVFSIPWRTSYEVNASNPLYFQGKVFIASGYGMGYGVFDVAGAEPKKLHADPDTRLIFQNSILDGGSVLAVFGDRNLPASLKRMDFVTGKIFWEAEIPGTRASMAKAGSSLIILSETGELIVGRYDETEFTPGGKKQILPRLCWAPLAVADGHLFARSNDGKAVCLKLP